MGEEAFVDLWDVLYPPETLSFSVYVAMDFLNDVFHEFVEEFAIFCEMDFFCLDILEVNDLDIHEADQANSIFFLALYQHT